MSYFRDDLSERIDRQNRENMGLDNSADRSIFNKRLFDYTSGPRTRPIFLPDPVVVGTPFEALPYFLDAGKTVIDLFKRQMGGSMFVPVDENAYQSTNPTITARPNRLSERDYYEKYLKVLMGEDPDGYAIDIIADPQNLDEQTLSLLTQVASFPRYDYDAANELYKQDSIAAELGGFPGPHQSSESRNLGDKRLENIRKFIEMTDEGKVRYIAPDFQFGGPTVFPSPFPIVDSSTPFSFVDQDPLEDTTPLVTDEPFEMTMTNVMSTENPNLFPQPGDNPFPLVDTFNPYTLEPSLYSQETIADEEEEETEEDTRGPFAKLSDAAVNVARGMNKIALRRQARQAERDKRIATSADNLFMVSDPIGARGMFDVQTGLAQPDNLVPYLPMGQMGIELEADEETIRELIAAGAQIKFD